MAIAALPAALAAYRAVESGAQGMPAVDGFGAALSRAMDGAVGLSRDAEAKSLQALEGKGDITDVVTALAKAELALQTTVAVRDRVVQAYQEIMRMPI
jgi:flagellar hook-basal body complex protein FliE